MQDFYNKIHDFMQELGFPEKTFEEFKEKESSDYVNFFLEHGARKMRYVKTLRKSIGNQGLILPGGNCIVTTKMKDGSVGILVQKREDGEVGFPGGSMEVWQYGQNTAVEPPIICAYREFYEEVGINLKTRFLKQYGETCSTIQYPNGDIAYGVSMFYNVELDYEEVEDYSYGGSSEGKMMLIKLNQVNNYTIFRNHQAIFKRLLSDENI